MARVRSINSWTSSASLSSKSPMSSSGGEKRLKKESTGSLFIAGFLLPPGFCFFFMTLIVGFFASELQLIFVPSRASTFISPFSVLASILSVSSLFPKYSFFSNSNVSW